MTKCSYKLCILRFIFRFYFEIIISCEFSIVGVFIIVNFEIHCTITGSVEYNFACLFVTSHTCIHVITNFFPDM